jgi:uncharacterized membrane protein YtjA (UPF0391 family)
MTVVRLTGLDCVYVTGARPWPGATAGRQGGAMAQARKIVAYILIIFVLYTIITSPARAADLVQVGFQGISNAAKGIGQFMTQLVK